jgi:hypothetical protein
MNYKEMSDFEINQKVARLYQPALRSIPNYCEEITSSWPIIYENKISLNYLDDGCCEICTPHDHARFDSITTPNASQSDVLRAAMISFLKMNE